jgi:hypothetical protein
VAVTPEASACIAALGIQSAVDRMVEYARQHFPELERIEVVLHERFELGDQPGLAVEAYSRRPFDPADPTDRDLDRWMVREFPSSVLEHLILCYRPGVPHAG